MMTCRYACVPVFERCEEEEREREKDEKVFHVLSSIFIHDVPSL